MTIPKALKDEKNCKVTVIGTGNTLSVADSVSVGTLTLQIQGNDNTLVVGENCTLAGLIKIRGSGCRIILGNGCTMGRATIFALEDGSSIEFGDDCMLSYDIYMCTSDSHSILDLGSGKRINRSGNIKLGNHVWLGFGAFLSKGVEIGDGSIVAAKGVVTKKFGSNVAIGGNPARVLRENVAWDRKLVAMDD